jgi:hypothetical protein
VQDYYYYYYYYYYYLRFSPPISLSSLNSPNATISYISFRPFRITKYWCPFNHVPKHCSFMQHNACIPRHIPWQLPWSVTILKLQCVAWQDESLTINRKGMYFPVLCLGSADNHKRRPARIHGVRPGVEPDTIKTQLHSVAATPIHSAIGQCSHFPSHARHWREDVCVFPCSTRETF